MKKYIRKIVLVMFLYLIYMLICKGNISSANQIIQDGTYTIKSAVNENFTIDVTGVSMQDCANIELWQYNGGKNQKFYFKYLGNDYYSISAIYSDKYLDVAWASTSNGANVEQYTYNGNYNQQWLVRATGDGYYNIISRCSGLYLDVENGNMYNGANVITWQSHGGKNQKFKIQPTSGIISSGTYTIESALNENYVFDIPNASTQNLTKLTIFERNNGNNQKFNIKDVGNGYYTICAVHSSKSLDVDGGSKKNGTNVIQYSLNNYDNQKWLLKYAGNNSYCIISKCSGLYLDIYGATAKNGTEVVTWVGNGGLNQKFKLIPTQANVVEDNGRSTEFKRQHPEIKIGIDVSKYNGEIDWNAVKKDGIDYAMIRAGFRGYGENGSLNEDPKLDEYVRGARAAGLDVGIYFFSQAKNFQEGVEEANYTISLIRKYDITYPVAFDTEESSSPTNTGRADNISVQDRTDATKGFCSTIKNAGYDTLIYASASWLKYNLYTDQLSEYNVWLAHYTGATQEDPLKRPSNYQGKYVMWQYTATGTVNGIGGNVDCNLFYYLKQ